MTVIILGKMLLILSWQQVKIRYANHQKRQQLQQYALQTEMAVVQENHLAHNLYSGLGQSIAALHIQLQVAQKLWQVDPQVAQESLSEAYQLSATLMQEVRQTVRTLSQKIEIYDPPITRR